MSLEIKNIRLHDINHVVNIHLNTFKGFFLASLGRSFLIHFYKTCIDFDENSIAIGAFENDKLVGFAIGSLNSKGYYGKLIKRNKMKYSLMGVRLLFLRPMALFRIFQNLKNSQPQNVNEEPIRSELLSIGVLENYKGSGVGKKLLSSYEHQAKSKGAKFVSLTTDMHNNDKVKLFYSSQGYEVLNEFISYPDRKMLKYIKKI